jgi:hypothetical protein
MPSNGRLLLVLCGTIAACGGRDALGAFGGDGLGVGGSRPFGASTSTSASTSNSGSSSSITTASSGSSTITTGSAGTGGGRIGGTGGSAGGPTTRPDAGSDGPLFSPLDASHIVPDASNLGGAACGGISYPPVGFYGENILFIPYEKVTPGAKIEMGAKLATEASLRIRMTLLSGSVWFVTGSGDWRHTVFDFATGVQTFQNQDSGRMIEHIMMFPDSGRALIEYFECDAVSPSGMKFLTWGAGETSE